MISAESSTICSTTTSPTICVHQLAIQNAKPRLKDVQLRFLPDPAAQWHTYRLAANHKAAAQYEQRLTRLYSLALSPVARGNGGKLRLRIVAVLRVLHPRNIYVILLVVRL